MSKKVSEQERIERVEELQRRATELANDIRVCSNETGEHLSVRLMYDGCQELGWMCGIEVRR